MIGHFGTTDARFKRMAMDGTCEPNNPGPGAYAPRTYSSVGKISQLQPTASKWTWGTGPGHNMNLGDAGRAPGPGAYGAEQHPMGGILTGLRRKWPGIATKSSFGTNAALPTLKVGADDNGNPGPGNYNAEEATLFTSTAPSGARSPYPAQARSVTGSRLQRDVDIKRGANFVSKSPAHELPFSGQKDGPGPSEYAPTVGTVGHDFSSRMSKLGLRSGATTDDSPAAPPPALLSLLPPALLAPFPPCSPLTPSLLPLPSVVSDGGASTSFDSTASRFSGSPGDVTGEVPGPGAHTVQRWNAELPSYRRPRKPPVSHTGGKCGFLATSERFQMPAGAGSGAGGGPISVVDFLAYGEAGPVGQPAHAQAALRNVADSLRAQ